MTRPATIPTWADSGTANKATVPTGTRADGFPFGSAVPSAFVNQELYEVGLWLTFLAAFVPSDGTLTAGRIVTGNDPLSAFGLVITDASGATGGIKIETTQAAQSLTLLSSSVGGGILFAVTGGAGTDAGITLTQATNEFTVAGVKWVWSSGMPQEGLTANDVATSRLRFAYAAAESISVDCSPGFGGWQFVAGTSGTLTGYIRDGGAALYRFVGAAVTGDRWVFNLPALEASGARAGTVWEITSLLIEAEATAAGRLSLTLWRKNRLTGAEAAVPSWTISSVNGAGALTVFQASPTAEALDLVTYSYTLRVVDIDNTGSTHQLLRAFAIFNKYAAD